MLELIIRKTKGEMLMAKTTAIYHDVTNNAGTGFKDVVKDIEMYVGMPCTWGVWSDAYPAHIQRISDSGKTVWIQDADAVADKKGGHDYFGSQKYIITPDPNGVIRKVTKRKDGKWKLQGTKHAVYFGHARKYSDPHF